LRRGAKGAALLVKPQRAKQGPVGEYDVAADVLNSTFVATWPNFRSADEIWA